MSKYEIEHACGHTTTVNICGTNVHGERERKAAWLASHPCDACRAAKNGEDGMAELKESEKQIAWALDIRSGLIRDYESFVNRCGKGAEGAEDAVAEIYSRMLSQLTEQTSAEWFIENQNWRPMQAFTEIAHELVA